MFRKMAPFSRLGGKTLMTVIHAYRSRRSTARAQISRRPGGLKHPILNLCSS